MSKKHKLTIVPPTEQATVVYRTRVSDNDVLFSFKHLVEESYPKCNDSKFFIGLLGRFHKYSTLGWQEVRASGRHQWGMEKNANKPNPPHRQSKLHYS